MNRQESSHIATSPQTISDELGELAFRKGAEHFLRNEFTDAAFYFQIAADRGHLASMQNLGTLYMKGDGVPQDENEGIRLYQQAASKGLIEAQYILAFIKLMNGRYRQAMRIFSVLAEGEGNVAAAANYDIAVLLFEGGRGITRNVRFGWKHMEAAAEGGNAEAQYRMGMKLIKKSVDENRDEGIDWLKRAAIQKHAGAKQELMKLNMPLRRLPLSRLFGEPNVFAYKH